MTADEALVLPKVGTLPLPPFEMGVLPPFQGVADDWRARSLGLIVP